MRWAFLLVFFSACADALVLPPKTSAQCIAKTSKVVIVGGGPSGIHMASQLAKKGYTDVVVLERYKNEERFGKTHSFKMEETGDVPHELGTCYLSSSYVNVRNLLAEYIGANSTVYPGGGPGAAHGALMFGSPRLVPGAALTDSEWFALNANRIGGHGMKDPAFYDHLAAMEVGKYLALHQQIFGVEDNPHGLPPQPVGDAMKHLNQTFREFMISNGMPNLLDYTITGLGSYGFGYDVPALYGLMMVNQMAARNLITKQLPFIEVVRKGFTELWKQMVLQNSLDLRRGHNVTRIERLEGAKHNFKIQVESGSIGDIFADELILATPISTRFVNDVLAHPSELQQAMARNMRRVSLNVVLYKTEKRTIMTTQGPLQDQALVFYPESLQSVFTPLPAGEVYAERNDVLAHDWRKDRDLPDRYGMVYQHYTTAGQNRRVAESNASSFITDPALTGSPVTGSPKVIRKTYYYNYMPHFSIEAVMRGLPWKIFDEQGRRHTWHIGDSVVFESAEDVVSYNEQVLGNTQLERRFC